MTDFNVPGRNEVSAKNQEIFDSLKNALGFVPNLYATLAYSENGLSNYLQFQNGKSSFSKKEKEAINLVVSQVNQCRYCQSAHTVLGKMNGFSEDQILQLRGGTAPWDSKLNALVTLAKNITEKQGKIRPELLSSYFAEGFSKENLIDLVLAIADKTVMNYVHSITQIPIDFPLAIELETEGVKNHCNSLDN